MSLTLLQNYDIKTTDSSIRESESRKQNFIKIIQDRWGDNPEGNYTTNQLEAWAEYGSPHAFYEQQYSFAPVFYDERSVPLPLNESLQKSQNQITLKKLGASLYTRKVLRSQDVEKISVCMRSVNRYRRTLISHYPSLKDLYTKNIMASIETAVYKLKYNTVAQLMTRLTYRLAHENGIYLDLQEIAEIIGIDREGVSIVYDFLNEIGLHEPSLLTINTNLIQRIRDLLTNLVQLDYVQAEEAGEINSKLDTIDITCLTNQKKFRAEINLILLIEDILQISTYDITKYFFDDVQFAVRNLSYARKNHQFTFTERTNENSHDSIFETMKHEFGLDIPHRLFADFTNQLKDLGTSEELAAILIHKTINMSSGVRSTIEAISSNPFDLISEYREFMKTNADHKIFNQIIGSVPGMNDEQPTIENHQPDVDETIAKISQKPILMTNNQEIDFNEFSRIIVVQHGHLTKGYSFTFLKLAKCLIDQGAWTLSDDREKFLAKLSESHPSLYKTFFEVMNKNHSGKYDNWVVQFNSILRSSSKQLLLINSEFDDIELYIESGNLLIHDFYHEQYSHMFPDIDGQLSLITIGNNHKWFSYNEKSDSLKFKIYNSVSKQTTPLLGHKGEIRRGLLTQMQGSVLWLESEQDFRKEIRRIFWKANAMGLDIDELITKLDIQFQPKSFTSLHEIREFLELDPPISLDIVIPDIRSMIKRKTPLLDPSFDLESYEQDLLNELTIELSHLEDQLQLELENIELEYSIKLQNGEITSNLFYELIEDYKRTQTGLYTLTKQQRLSEIDEILKDLKHDRTLEPTEQLLHKYNANYDQAMEDLEFILSRHIIHIGCSLSQKAKIKQPDGVFQSKNELDQKLLEIFSNYGIIHTDFPISNGMILHKNNKSENIHL